MGLHVSSGEGRASRSSDSLPCFLRLVGPSLGPQRITEAVLESAPFIAEGRPFSCMPLTSTPMQRASWSR